MRIVTTFRALHFSRRRHWPGAHTWTASVPFFRIQDCGYREYTTICDDIDLSVLQQVSTEFRQWWLRVYVCVLSNWSRIFPALWLSD